MILQDGAQTLTEAVTEFHRLQKYWIINGGVRFSFTETVKFACLVKSINGGSQQITAS
jgi:hypothetical protein